MKNSTVDTARMSDVAHDVVDKVEEKVTDSLDKARAAGHQVEEKVNETGEQIQEAIAVAGQSISDYVVEKPLQAAGIAFTAGVLATLILTRNKS